MSEAKKFRLITFNCSKFSLFYQKNAEKCQKDASFRILVYLRHFVTPLVITSVYLDTYEKIIVILLIN